MTTYPPVPDPPEPERSEPDPPGGDPAAGGWNPSSPSAENASGSLPDPAPEGTPQFPPPSPANPPPSYPPPPVGGGFDPYSGGAVPPPPPPPPPYNGDGPIQGQQPRNGLGTAALVCGIIAVVTSFIPGLNWFTWPLGVLAIVFGAIGWSRANKGQATNKGIAITGLVLGILSFFTFCLIWIIIGAGAGSMTYDAAPFL
ncbi:DUF4190 domain-containing protein [Glycomyces paridis]|uniref:DUF4190 domain-containing protein n=1 Tax=Glycomyces paridis TaxID=2126555 RepID=A0A4S8PCG1_9ACTN|nr:DUF4190 domain-containing protein [Glycomyces paridis]THV28008.1 DUF4190 domain-containing protein [Glycomyces paridis]